MPRGACGRPGARGAAGRRAGGQRPFEQAGRRTAVPERLHRPGAPVPGVRQAWRSAFT